MSDNPQWPDLPLAAVERDLRHAASMDANCRQGADRVHATHQSLVERDTVCERAWPRRTGDALSRRHFRRHLDFASHRLIIETSGCRTESFALKPMTVAEFYAAFMEKLRRLGIDVRIWTMPGEIENAVPFDRMVRMRNTIRFMSRNFGWRCSRPIG